MSEADQTYNDIIDFLNYLKSSGEFSRADMDQLEMMVSSCASMLPKKFVDVVNQFENKFNSHPPVQMSFIDRLQRIHSVHEKYPSNPDINELDDLYPTFHLNKKDRSRVFELCEQMRKIIIASTDFDQPHKIRILNRIAAIEKQVNLEKGLFDIVRGGVEDVGETLGKFGVSIKPLTDRMNEVTSIVRRNTPAYNQIPAPEDVKQLPAPDMDD